uniref:Uncharacterized protein n=1 Tax=Arundo donax TaxID=35708 RepID=A0A0A9GXF0_ARUDO
MNELKQYLAEYIDYSLSGISYKKTEHSF